MIPPDCIIPATLVLVVAGGGLLMLLPDILCLLVSLLMYDRWND